jgi:uroporphyrinogen-III synthase
MNLIVLSQMSIYKDMQKYCMLHKVSIHQIMAVKTFPIKYDLVKIIDILNDKINIIFQSKNAIDYSLEIHEKIKNNNKIKIYCLGKYSARKVKETFFLEALYPQKNYSSEKLLEHIIEDTPIKSKFLIVKGQDGRNYLEDKIKEKSHEVLVIDVYKREPESLDSLKDLIKANVNNYFIISSKTALENLVSKLKLIKRKNKNILIIPNIRLIEGVNMDNISDTIVINNNEEASEYIRIIKEHNNG